MEDSVTWLAEMTWPEVEAALAEGRDAALLVLGATEQHGPHLPLGTDTLLAEELARRLAQRLGCIALPVLPVGCSDEHLAFPGTLSLRTEVLVGVILDVARSLAHHGFHTLILVSAHGGNANALQRAAARVREEVPALEVIVPADLTTEVEAELQRAVAQGISPAVAGLHAGERETSRLLAVRPDLVRRSQAAPGYVGDMAAILPRLMREGLRPVTPNGVLGDPTPADPQRGEAYLEMWVTWLVDRIVESWRDSPSSPASG